MESYNWNYHDAVGDIIATENNQTNSDWKLDAEISRRTGNMYQPYVLKLSAYNMEKREARLLMTEEVETQRLGKEMAEQFMNDLEPEPKLTTAAVHSAQAKALETRLMTSYRDKDFPKHKTPDVRMAMNGLNAGYTPTRVAKDMQNYSLMPEKSKHYGKDVQEIASAQLSHQKTR